MCMDYDGNNRRDVYTTTGFVEAFIAVTIEKDFIYFSTLSR